MPDCGYCDESFADEASYHEHLRTDHADELGPIDRRRVASDGDGGGLPTGPLALGLVLVASAAVVGYIIFLSGGGGGGTAGDGPTNIGSVHYHGTIEMVVAGETVDFGQPEYQRPQEYPAFHFEGGDGTTWHGHAEEVTVAYAMSTLDISVTADTVTFEGTTYDDANPDTTVSITVDGEPVTPSTYVLQEGDSVRILVEVE